MKTIVLDHGDLAAAARPCGVLAPRSFLRSRVRSVSGALVRGRTERPAVTTLPPDPTLDLTAIRTA